jgi:hypothetical protein
MCAAVIYYWMLLPLMPALFIHKVASVHDRDITMCVLHLCLHIMLEHGESPCADRAMTSKQVMMHGLTVHGEY